MQRDSWETDLKNYLYPGLQFRLMGRAMDLPLNTRFITITAEDREGHVRFTFAGRYNYPDFSAIIRGLREECARRGMTRAVIDIRQVEGDIPGHERYDLGSQFAEVWGSRLRAAILSPADRINKLFENTAVNRYADVMVSHDEAILMQWLMAAE
jgi:hypothetical protein